MNAVVMTKPSQQFWLQLLFIPFATVVAVAMPLGIYVSITHADVSRSVALVIWACLSAIVLGYCIVHDPHVLTWTLTENDLRRGRKRNDIVISFEEIDSIVIGLPPHLPWYLQLTRFHRACRNLVALRRMTLLLRLHGGRLLPLNLMTVQYQNGQALMESLLRLNESKVTGPETYTEAEIRRLKSAVGFNRIINV